MSSEAKWQTYQEAAVYLLNQFKEHFGLEKIEGEQKVPGLESGTSWAIDGKGIYRDGAGFVVVECRRYMASKQDQEKVGGLVYKIIDTGAKGGIVVSSLGLQKGAELVAKARNIINVHLSPDSTQTEYLLQFLNQVMVGFQGQVSFEGSLEAELKRQEQ